MTTPAPRWDAGGPLCVPRSETRSHVVRFRSRSPLNPAVAGDSQLGFTPSPGNAAAGHRSEQPPAPRAGSDRGGMASQRDGRASPGPSPDRGAPGWDADEGSASPSQDSPANSGREGAALARLRTVEHLYAIDFENSRPDMGARLDFLTQPQDVLPRTQLGEQDELDPHLSLSGASCQLLSLLERPSRCGCVRR